MTPSAAIRAAAPSSFSRLRLLACIGLAAMTLLSPGSVAAQAAPGAWEAVRLEISRERLQEVKTELERHLAQGGGDDRTRANARLQIRLIEQRLAEGDFEPGDRVYLEVEREVELTDTFTVVSGPALRLPVVGQVSLDGVLASELNDHLTREISRVLRDPVVRARAMVQVSVVGDVANPGFYVVTPDALVADVIMIAGGPTADAKIDEVTIERGPTGTVTPPPDDMLSEDVDIGSMSVDDLGLQSGDRIMVPGDSFTTRDVIQFSVLGLTAIVSLLSIFN